VEIHVTFGGGRGRSTQVYQQIRMAILDGRLRPGEPPPPSRELAERLEEGLVVDALPGDARLVYVSPSHQFPLGMAMSLRRRMALLAWAARRGAAIVEDDYDSDFRFTGRPVEPLHSLDGDGRVIYAGSFSKCLQRSGPAGAVDGHPPPAVGAGLPDRDVVEGGGGRLATTGWNLQGDRAHHIAEASRALHVLHGDGPCHVRALGRLARGRPELADRVPSPHRLIVGCHDHGVLRIEGGHGRGVAPVEQFFERSGEPVNFLPVKGCQGHR